MSTEDLLERIFDADRQLREAENAFLHSPEKEIRTTLLAAIDAARAIQGDDGRSRRGLLAELLTHVPADATSVDALVGILGDDDAVVRAIAGRALLAIGFERYAELARASERALEKQASPFALEELPWIIAEIAEPSALKLIAKFLDHSAPPVVASAMEALVDLGDPSAIRYLEKFKSDQRVVTIDDHDDQLNTTLAELAGECIEELEGDEDDL